MKKKMAENLTKRPQKGILKSSSSFEQQEAQKRLQDIKWDEMNILQTLHPPDKDYGHMKIEEPKTPYNYYTDELDAGSEKGPALLDAAVLAEKIALGSEQLPKAMIADMDDDDDDSEEEENETEEEREKRKAFEYKRKNHYNEFHAVKLARKLMQQDDNDDSDDVSEVSDTQGNAEDAQNSNSSNVSTSPTRTVE